jgi:hypothetical protein
MSLYNFILAIFLFLFPVVMVLMHAVHKNVLFNQSSKASDWVSAITHTLPIHHNIQQVLLIIGGQVTVIVAEIESRKTFRKWKFSHNDAHTFADKLTQCVKDNLM